MSLEIFSQRYLSSSILSSALKKMLQIDETHSLMFSSSSSEFLFVSNETQMSIPQKTDVESERRLKTTGQTRLTTKLWNYENLNNDTKHEKMIQYNV